MAIGSRISHARTPRRGERENSRGAVLAELSLALVVIMPIFAGVVRISLLVSQRMDLIQASRILTRDSFVAASSATSGVDLCAALRQVAGTSLESVGLQPLAYTVSVSTPSSPSLPDSFPSYAVMVAIAPWQKSGLLPLQEFPTFVFVKSAVAQDLGACSGPLEASELEHTVEVF